MRLRIGTRSEQQHAGATWLRSPEAPCVRDWLSASAVRRCQFHRTSATFDEFDTNRGDLGSHFGPLNLVNTLPRYDAGITDGDQVIPVWLRITNPIRLKDERSFHADGIAVQLAKKGLLTMKEARSIFAACDSNWRQRRVWDPRLRGLIQDAGFDGVVYDSLWDAERGQCFIAFEPEQVRPALPARAGMPKIEQIEERPRCRG